MESQRQEADIRTLIILAFSATAGVLVEFYDFYIYGFAAATAFPAIFFPKLPPTQALVFSYWLLRPGSRHGSWARLFSDTSAIGWAGKVPS